MLLQRSALAPIPDGNFAAFLSPEGSPRLEEQWRFERKSYASTHWQQSESGSRFSDIVAIRPPPSARAPRQKALADMMHRKVKVLIVCILDKKKTTWSRGPMDKASAHGAGDCRFESCRDHICHRRIRFPK